VSDGTSHDARLALGDDQVRAETMYSGEAITGRRRRSRRTGGSDMATLASPTERRLRFSASRPADKGGSLAFDRGGG